MSKLHYGLGGLLLAQLVLAVIIFWADGSGQNATRQGPLFEFQTGAIDRIVLSDSENRLTLERKEGRWQLPERERLPAQNGKINDILDTLTAFSPTWPVTTTGSSHARFEVADDKFQRRIQLYSGETLASEALLGTSPGFRKSHIRKAGDDAIYTIALNTVELPVKNENWLDKSLLKAADVERIESDGFTIEKAEMLWRFAPGTDISTGELDQDKALKLATALETLQIAEIAEKVPEQEGKILKIKDKHGEWTYRFVQDGDDHFVSRNDRETVFTIAKFDFDRIAGLESAQLIKEKPKPEEQQDETGRQEAAQ